MARPNDTAPKTSFSNLKAGLAADTRIVPATTQPTAPGPGLDPALAAARVAEAQAARSLAEQARKGR